MIICFEEKHGNRYVEGPDRASILAYVLSDRISDTYGAMFGAGGDDTSVWYDDETERARQYLGAGKAEQYMTWRRAHEYEDWHELQVEKIEPQVADPAF